MHKNISLLVLVFLLPALAWGQSLGDAARKERERREKNKKQGVAAREFSEKEIFGEDEENQEGEEPAEGAGEGEAADGEQQSQRSVPSIDSDSKSQESEELEDDRRDRRREEAEWRARFQQAKQRIVAAREQVQFLKDLNLVPGERYVDVHGNTVIRSLEQLRRLVEVAEEEFSTAEQALLKLQADARRAGVPPGWSR